MNTEPKFESPAKTRFIAACLLNAGRIVETEQLFSLCAKSELDGLGSLLGLAYARQGKLDEAVAAYLKVIERSPKDQEARINAVGLLHKQAVQKINARDWAGAGNALGEALRIDPTNPEIRSLVTSVENVLPIAYLRAGKREDASTAWEKIQLQEPDNGRVAHSLALLFSFGAAALEKQGQTSEADLLWQKAIGNWVLVRFNDEFWKEWAHRRSSVYQVPPNAVDGLRETWGEELSKRISQFAAEREAAGKEKDAARFRQLEMLYWLERTTAAALYELKTARCPHCREIIVASPGSGDSMVCGNSGCKKRFPIQRSHDLPICGPIMLKHLARDKDAQEFVGKAQELTKGTALSGFLATASLPLVKTNSEVLKLCLSSRGPTFALVARRHFQEAIDGYVAVGPDLVGDPLFLYACLERGKQLAAASAELPELPTPDQVERYLAPRRQALEVWRKALMRRDAPDVLANQIGERIEATFVGAANELNGASTPFAEKKQYAEEIRLISAAIELLKAGVAVVRRPRIVTTLTALYVERGLSYRRADDSISGLNRAIADFEEALKVSPNDDAAKRRLAEMFNLKGVKASGNEAIRCFDRAIELEPQNHLFFRNRGIERANSNDYDKAINDLTSACRLGGSYTEELASACNGKAVKIMNGYAPGHYEKREAREAAQLAVQLAPGNSTYRNNLNLIIRNM